MLALGDWNAAGVPAAFDADGGLAVAGVRGDAEGDSAAGDNAANAALATAGSVGETVAAEKDPRGEEMEEVPVSETRDGAVSCVGVPCAAWNGALACVEDAAAGEVSVDGRNLGVVAGAVCAGVRAFAVGTA